MGINHVTRTNLSSLVRFDAITEYPLPNPNRMPNAVTVAPDGSVWFGEQTVPGVAHLMSNGTLTEYEWPSSTWRPQTDQGLCGVYKTGIWGIALWNGMVWASDGDYRALVGLSPDTGQFKVLNISTGSFPTTITVGPDGALWFTLESEPASIGRVSPDYHVSVYRTLGNKSELPQEIYFVNSTYAYYVSPTPTCATCSGLYSFNPQNVSSGIIPTKIGPSFKIVLPTSVSAADGSIWIAQHGTSSILAYNRTASSWRVYPTSAENFTYATFPYFVRANGSMAWFSEHCANRIAVLDATSGVLTEFSEANPPVYNGSLIGSDLSIALAKKGLWFTSLTKNYVGFVDATYKPTFSLSLVSSNTIRLTRGQQTTLQLDVAGNWSSPLSVTESDSENYSSIPNMIRLTPSVSSLKSANGPQSFQVTLGVKSEVALGGYTLAITVSDGLVLRTAYVFLEVTS